MDLIKIGNFLADLRKEHGLTQEQLGEEIGVTNKTVSRWENGNYLPPVEMLQILSEKYNLTINEILSGERLDEESYKVKAEENIATALDNSVFSLQDKQTYFKKKWQKDHRFELILEMIILLAATVLGALFYPSVTVLCVLLCMFWAIRTNNRRAKYVEDQIYGDINTQEK